MSYFTTIKKTYQSRSDLKRFQVVKGISGNRYLLNRCEYKVADEVVWSVWEIFDDNFIHNLSSLMREIHILQLIETPLNLQYSDNVPLYDTDYLEFINYYNNLKIQNFLNNI